MGQRAVVSYVRPDYVRGEFMESALALAHFSETTIDTFLPQRSGPNIVRARNAICRKFMTEQTAPWLLMVDTDMVFNPDVLDRLVAAAHPVDRPIVGALCFSESDNGGEPYSTMYEIVQRGPQRTFARYAQWEEDTLKPVTGTGTGCLLVHRDALDRIAQAKPLSTVTPWFKEMVLDQLLMGEDLYFCLKAQAAGLQVYVHTGIQVGHLKSTMLGKVR